MSDTLHERSEAPGRGGKSLLATRAANTLRYSVMNIFILLGIVGTACGRPAAPGRGLLLSFVLIGYVDELFGDAGAKERMPPVWYCQLMLFLTLPLIIFATLVTFNVASPHRLPLARRALPRRRHRPRWPRAPRTGWFWSQGAFVSLGMYYGAAGVNVSHELVHRVGQAVRPAVRHLAPRLHLGHRLCHRARPRPPPQRRHRARPGDRAARRIHRRTSSGRSTVGQWLAAKRFEDERLKRKGIPNTLWTNRFWRNQLMTLVVVALLRRLPRPRGHRLVSPIAGAIGKIYLEVVNYIEHYGLVRIPGTRVEARHSWDSHRRVSGGMFYNLMLHANHHKIATRRYWELEQSPPEEAATLPRGYMAMILFAFLGPPFFRYINKHLARWDSRAREPRGGRLPQGQGPLSRRPRLGTLSPPAELFLRRASRRGDHPMLKWALIFFVISIVTRLLGFTGISAASAGIAKILFYVFLVLLVITLIVALAIGQFVFIAAASARHAPPASQAPGIPVRKCARPADPVAAKGIARRSTR